MKTPAPGLALRDFITHLTHSSHATH
jgi:hypothetical protein